MPEYPLAPLFVLLLQKVLLLWSWFIVCKVSCGGDAYFGAMVHCCVHVFTYSYYLFTLLKIPCPWKERCVATGWPSQAPRKQGGGGGFLQKGLS